MKNIINGRGAITEGRMVAVETRMETVTTSLQNVANDIRDLSAVVRQQGTNIEGQISQLLVAVTQASAPRKTDWQTLIAGVGLILAIGAAAFSPLLLRLNDVQNGLGRLEAREEKHEALPMHPVGMARLDAIERITNERTLANAEAIKTLDIKLQREAQLQNDLLREKTEAVNRTVAELDTRLQREFTLANIAIKETAVTLEKVTTERINFQAEIGAIRYEALQKLSDRNLERIMQLEDRRQTYPAATK